MGLAELLVVAVGLSMDAFTVSVCEGLGMPRIDRRRAVLVGAAFGLFQGLMPVAGWLLGTQASRWVEPVDHWIAFALLALIGSKMIVDALREPDGGASDARGGADQDGAGCARPPRTAASECRRILLLAVATSIDALAVGVTFAFLGVDILSAALVIGVTTCILSIAGVCLGSGFGRRFEKGACVFGGAVLIGIGLKILLEHLGIL